MKTLGLSVSQDNKGEIKYILMYPKNQIDSAINPMEQISKAQEEIEQVRKLTKPIFKN